MRLPSVMEQVNARDVEMDVRLEIYPDEDWRWSWTDGV